MTPTVAKPVLAICLPATQVSTSPSAPWKPKRNCTICEFRKDLKEIIRKGHVVHTSIAKYCLTCSRCRSIKSNAKRMSRASKQRPSAGPKMTPNSMDYVSSQPDLIATPNVTATEPSSPSSATPTESGVNLFDDAPSP
jgi:hypothetical protein